jgi:hypothetical protein
MNSQPRVIVNEILSTVDALRATAVRISTLQNDWPQVAEGAPLSFAVINLHAFDVADALSLIARALWAFAEDVK